MKLWRSNLFIGIALALILLVSVFFRVVNIQTDPPGLTWDEAALGYNAYSILQTGKDEYGQPFPLIFKSFGDYKPGLYVYLAVPFVATMGLTELSVRMPSIILGSLLPLIGYLLIVELYGKNKKVLGLITAFLLAVSAWAIPFSRGAWETNVYFFELILGLYLFERSKNSLKVKYNFKAVSLLLASFLIFSLSFYTYQSAKLISILFLSLMILFNFRTFFKGKIKFITVLGFSIFILTFLSSIADPIARSRLDYLNQYNYQRSVEELAKIDSVDQMGGGQFLAPVFHSQQLEYLRTVSSRYLNYFSPKEIYVSGPPDGRSGVLGYGLSHLLLLPFFLAGLFFLLRLYRKESWPLILLGLIIPITAALSRDLLNTVRTLPLTFFIESTTAVGIYQLFKNIKLANLRIILITVFSLLMIFNLGYFYDQYFTHARIGSSKFWLGGQKEAVEYIKENQSKYQKVVFSPFYGQPYIFYLFYTQYPPEKFQQQAKLIQPGKDVGDIQSLDNIEFRRIYWPADRGEKNILYVGNWIELPVLDLDPKQARLIKDIKFLDGEIAFKIVETVAK